MNLNPNYDWFLDKGSCFQGYEYETIKPSELKVKHGGADKMNEELQIGIGKKEATSLQPAKVEVMEVNVEEVGAKGSKKLICLCKHPNKDELIKLSSVKYEKKGKLTVVGLWFNKDEDGLITKGSALAVFLEYTNCKSPSELIKKALETTLDDNGYLCFKAY